MRANDLHVPPKCPSFGPPGSCLVHVHAGLWNPVTMATADHEARDPAAVHALLDLLVLAGLQPTRRLGRSALVTSSLRRRARVSGSGLPAERRARQPGRRSHYRSDEIIMTGAPRPHHRNIYCIIYSSGPLVQGRTYKLQTLRLCSLAPVCRSKQRRPRAFYPSFFLLLLFFSSVHRGPEAPTPTAALIFIYFIFLFFFFSSVQSERLGRVGGASARRKAAAGSRTLGGGTLVAGAQSGDAAAE